MSVEGGRLRAPSYFVLASLLDGPRHGYVILGDVETLSEGTVRLAAGTLYAVLDRLEGAGLIEVDKEEVVNGRTRALPRLDSDRPRGAPGRSGQACGGRRHGDRTGPAASRPIVGGEVRVSDILARRYKVLLRAYAPRHRRRWGDELLGTLMDRAEPSRRWPAPREVTALLASAFRTRLHADRTAAPSAVWTGGLQLAYFCWSPPSWEI